MSPDSGPGFAGLRVGRERGGELVDRRDHRVEFDGGAGAAERDVVAVGEGRAVGVDGGELEVAVGHDRRRHPRRDGVGGDLRVRVEAHRDLDVGAARGDLVDGADRDAEHRHLVALVHASDVLEIGCHVDLFATGQGRCGTTGGGEQRQCARGEEFAEPIRDATAAGVARAPPPVQSAHGTQPSTTRTKHSQLSGNSHGNERLA